MAGPEDQVEEKSTYHRSSAPEQDRQYQVQQECAMASLNAAHDTSRIPYHNVPHIPSFDFASINEIAYQQFPSSQIHMNETSNKRRRISTEHALRRLLPKSERATTSNLTSNQYAFPAAMNRGAQQHAIYPKNTAVSEALAGSHDGGLALRNYRSPSQRNAVPAHPQTLYPSPRTQIQAPSQSSTNRWAQAREYRCKVHEPPQIDPHEDPTLANVEQNAESWVNQLIIAMSNIEDVKDTETSHARRMFLRENLCPLLIEATSREIFTSVLDRCKHGFRGPATFNKALKPHRDSEPDKTALCQERMENVVEVLRYNKRVCKDVLYEDWKIRLFVNHPLAYDKEKDSQKGSNDQRRVRLEREREKLKKTEQELAAYREARQSEATREAGFEDAVHVQPNNTFAGAKRLSNDGGEAIEAQRQGV